jgi:hypothetical protein
MIAKEKRTKSFAYKKSDSQTRITRRAGDPRRGVGWG